MSSAAPPFDPFKALDEIRDAAATSVEPELSQQLSQAPAKAENNANQTLSSTFATFAGGQPAHGLAPARVKEEERRNNLTNSYTYARQERSHGPTPACAVEGAAKVAKVARETVSHCATIINRETVSAKVSQGALQAWIVGLSTLSTDRPPCPGYRPSEWPRVLARALAFLDDFGPQAVAVGWTASRLFGAHPQAGIVRVDACGALVLPTAGDVRAITATEVQFSHLTHRVKPGQPEGVPLWEIGR